MSCDLAFHVNERTYTLPVMAGYHWLFPDDPNASNLKHWANCEEYHPNTFAGMYNLVLQKT